ncbi:MAG: hypothetical protein R6U61_09300 [Thermoplasmata archaeon]
MSNGSDDRSLLEKQGEAIKRFEAGKKPSDVVKSGVCDMDEAEFLYQQYKELKRFSEGSGGDNISPDLENMVEKLSTQIGLLGSRLARIELKIMNSNLLPKTRKCSKCGKEGAYGVGAICTDCGNVDAHLPDDIHQLSIQDVDIKGYRPWEKK